MSSYRLMVLGLLAAGGPMHGHRIRGYAVEAEVERWAGVKVGSLYAALHRMELDGLVEVVRREQEGRRPARTVYGITGRGEEWLETERRAALADRALPPMAIDLAIAFGREPDVDALRRALDTRRRAVEAYGSGLAERRERGLREGLKATTIAALRHIEHRVDAELAWMAELDLEALAAVAVAARQPEQA